MDNFTLIIQGNITKEAFSFYRKNYLNFPVIISTWNTCRIKARIPDNFKIIYSDEPTRILKSNFELQLKSTSVGLEHVQTEYCLKIRGDEWYSNIEEIVNKIKSNPEKIINSPVFFRKPNFFQFHMSDHFIGGRTYNLKLMFDFDFLNFKNLNYTPEQFLTHNYLSKKNENYQDYPIKSMTDNFLIIKLENHQPYRVCVNSMNIIFDNNFNSKENNSIDDIEECKIKIAVCLSGQIRTWEFCKENIQNFLKNSGEYQIDFFIHTWDKNNYGELVISDKKQQRAELLYKNDKEFKNFIDYYNPKLFKIEDSEKFKNKLFKKWKDKNYEPINTMFLMYSFYKSIILKKLWERKNGFKYDYVIKLRPDIHFFGVDMPTQINLLNESYKKNSKEKNFISYQLYEKTWNPNVKSMLSNYFGADLYWLFRNNDAETFSTFYIEKLKFDKKNKNKVYTQYYHTHKMCLNPLRLDQIKEPWVSIIRIFHAPFLNLLGDINSKNYIYNFMLLSLFFEPDKFGLEWLNDIKDHKNFVDFLNENNNIKEDLKNNGDFITFANKNPFLVHLIRKYFRVVSKYL